MEQNIAMVDPVLYFCYVQSIKDGELYGELYTDAFLINVDSGRQNPREWSLGEESFTSWKPCRALS